MCHITTISDCTSIRLEPRIVSQPFTDCVVSQPLIDCVMSQPPSDNDTFNVQCADEDIDHADFT